MVEISASISSIYELSINISASSKTIVFIAEQSFLSLINKSKRRPGVPINSLGREPPKANCSKLMFLSDEEDISLHDNPSILSQIFFANSYV